MMRVLITGGTGLIGRALSANLTADGHEVIVLSRSLRYTPPLSKNVQLVKWDAETSYGWGHLIDGATAVINLAGASLAGEGFLPTRWTQKRLKIIRESRLQASQAIVEAVSRAKKKPHLVVQSSTVGYYGYRGDEVLDEHAEAGDDWGARFTSLEWEPSTLTVESMGVRRVVIRSGVVMSMDGGALPRLLLPFRLFIGGTMGSGKQWYSWIHIQDHIRALRFFIENSKAHGVYNVTVPYPARNAEFAWTIAKLTKRPAFIPVPGFLMRSVFGEVADVVLKGQRVIPQHLLNHGFTFKFPNIKDALNDLLK